MNKIIQYILLLILSTPAFGQITWDKQVGPYGGTIDKMVFNNSKTFAISNRNLFVNDINWQRLIVSSSTNSSIKDFEIIPGKYYVIADAQGSDDGVLYTSDNGVTFTQKNTASFFKKGLKIKINPVNNNLFVLGYKPGSSKYGFWTSPPDGTTWSVTTADLGVNPPTDFVITSTGQIIVLDQGTIYRSDDGGASFFQKTTNISDPTLISQIIINAAGTKVYCVSDSGPYESTDAGDNWSSIKGGITGTNFGNKSILQFTQDANSLFFVDNNNHKLWSTPASAIVFTNVVSSNYLSSGSFTGIQVNCLAGNNAASFMVGTANFGVYTATGGGSSISESNTGLESLNFRDLEIADNGNLIVAGENGLFVYDGASWTKKNLGGVNAFIHKIVKSKSGPLLIALGSVNYNSVNNGVTWTASTSPPVNNSFASDAGTKIWAADNGTGLYFSDNAGASWNAVTVAGFPVGTSIQKIVSTQKEIVLARIRDNSGVFRLYQIVSNPDPQGAIPTTGAAAEVPFGQLGTGGPPFTSVDEIQYVEKVVYAYNQGSSAKLNYSQNDGVNGSWSNFKNLPGSNSVFVDTPFKYIFTTKINNNGATTDLSFSRDGGSNFTTATSIATNYAGFFADIELNSSGVGYALVSGLGILKTSGTLVIPSMPGSVSIVGVGNTSLTIKFSNSSAVATSYRVERFDGTQFNTIGTVIPTSSGGDLYFYDSNLQPTTDYNYVVYAVNAAGSSQGNQIFATTLSNAFPPFIPDNRSWTGVTQNGNAPLVMGAGGLNIVIKHQGNGTYLISDITGGVLPNIPGPPPMDPNQPPSYAPSILPATFFMGNNSVYLRPATVTNNGQQEYHVYENGNGSWTDGTKTLILKWNTNSNPLTSAGPPYPVYPGVNTEFKLTLNATDPIPAPPTSVVALSFDNNNVEVSWKSTAFEEQFFIERAPDMTGSPGAFVPVGFVNYPVTQFLDNTVTLNTKYHYRVKASNAAGSIGTSNVAVVTFTKPNLVLANSTVSNTIGSTSGAIWGDFDNDGFDDLIMISVSGAFTGQGGKPFAFKNNGLGDFTAVDLNIDLSTYLSGTAGDYNNDGKLDLFLATTGAQNYLFTGNGNFTFTKVLSSPVTESGAGGSIDSSPFSSSWVDYDKDGKLDLLVANSYVMPGSGQSLSFLFHQKSDGSFEKISSGDLSTFDAKASSQAWADYDNDGDMDLFLSNSAGGGQPNALFRNDNGVLTHVVGSVFDADINLKTQSASWGDLNNDGFMDLVLGLGDSPAKPTYVYKNNGNGTFTKQSSSLPMTEVKVSGNQTFGTAIGDINNDGFIDILVSNALDNFIYLNTSAANFTFTKVSNEKFNASNQFTTGVALADYNKDGFLDVVNSGLDQSLPSIGKNYLYKNNNTTGNWVEFKMVGTTSNKSAFGTRLKLISGGVTQIREVNSASGFTSQNSSVVHFGLGANSALTLQINWPSGLVQNISNPPINQIYTLTEESTPPAVVTRLPANNSTGISVTTAIELTFDEPPFAVATKKLSIYPHGSSTAESQINVTAGVISGNKISFTLATPLVSATQYDIGVDAGAITDIYGNAIAVLAAGDWTFTTVDVTPPVTTFVPEPVLNKGFGNHVFVITATDNLAVTGATMSFRKISVATFTNLAGTFNAGKWEFALQESAFDEMGLEYFFTAKDAATNEGRSPLDPLVYHKTKIDYPEDAAKFTIPKGGTKAGYQIISVPLVLANPDIASNFEELGAEDHNKFRLIRYHETPSPGWDEYPSTLSTLKRGEGYFINVKELITLSLSAGSAPDETQDGFFKMDLKKGWNQVGNPYLVPILWSDALAINNNPVGVGKSVFYNGTSYVVDDTRTISPFSGAFVQCDNDVSNFKIPFKGFTSGGRTKSTTLPTEIDQEGWRNFISLKQYDMSYEVAAFGMAADASVGKDSYDLITPPRLGDYLELSTSHPEHFMKRFAQDIVTLQDEYAWEFNVETSQDGETILDWDNSKFGDNSKDLFLFDLNLQGIVNMREQNAYTFDPRESRNFKIYFGEQLNSKIKPFKTMSKTYPNPTNGISTISFTLPEQNGESDVKLEIFDMMGRRVSTLTNGVLKPGFYNAEWNATEVNGGVYTYRLAISGQTKREILTGKIVLKK